MDESPTPLAERLRRSLANTQARLRGPLLFGAGILAAFLALMLFNTVSTGTPSLTRQDVNAAVQEAMASATPPAAYSAEVYQAVWPSLVFIQVRSLRQDGVRAGGIGSGIVVNGFGDILTSLHVVSAASDIRVTFADGTQSSAQVIAEQPEIDIAVLRPERVPEQVVPATLGNPNAMRVGDEAYVIGHPLGLSGSLSAGVISGFDRSFKPVGSDQRLEGLIQVDAAVNPGNSGGPLLNRAGQVVGIVTALANPGEQDVFIGIGFAVPITVAGGAAGLPPY
jgi:S1-C subfamily serine protease